MRGDGGKKVIWHEKHALVDPLHFGFVCGEGCVNMIFAVGII